MKKELLTLFIVLLSVYQVYSQTKKDSIFISHHHFVSEGKVLKSGKLYNLMEDNPEAVSALNSYNTNNSAAIIITFIGGLCIWNPIGRTLASRQPRWEFAGIGAGLILLSIPFHTIARDNMRLAVRLHNQKLDQPGTVKTKIDLGLTDNGLGIKFRF